MLAGGFWIDKVPVKRIRNSNSVFAVKRDRTTED